MQHSTYITTEQLARAPLPPPPQIKPLLFHPPTPNQTTAASLQRSETCGKKKKNNKKTSEELHSVDVQYQHSRLTQIYIYIYIYIERSLNVYKEQYCYKYNTILFPTLYNKFYSPSLQNNNITSQSRYCAKYVQDISTTLLSSETYFI